MVNIYFDGGSRNKAGVGGYIIHCENNIIFWGGKYFDKATNNEAEYWGLILALRRATEEGIYGCHIYSDSKLIVNQVKNKWQINYPHLQKLKNIVDYELGKFDYWTLEWIPREQNEVANWVVDYYFQEKNNA